MGSAICLLAAAIVCLRPLRIHTRRRSFGLLAAGVTSYGLGNILWTTLALAGVAPARRVGVRRPVAGFLPARRGGHGGADRIRGRNRPPAGVWLDGIVAGAGLAAIGAAHHRSHRSCSATRAARRPWPRSSPIRSATCCWSGSSSGTSPARLAASSAAGRRLGGAFLRSRSPIPLRRPGRRPRRARPSAVTNLIYLSRLASARLRRLAGPAEPARAEVRLVGSVLLVPGGFMLAALGLLLYRPHAPAQRAGLRPGRRSPWSPPSVRMAVAFRDVPGLAEARRLAAPTTSPSLPNRRRFMALTEEAIAATEASGRGLAVLMLDLDNFKQLNDTLGPRAGDALLRQIGPRLRTRPARPGHRRLGSAATSSRCCSTRATRRGDRPRSPRRSCVRCASPSRCTGWPCA